MVGGWALGWANTLCSCGAVEIPNLVCGVGTPSPPAYTRLHTPTVPLRRPRTRHDSHTIVASTRARSRSTNLSIYLMRV